MSRKKIDPFVIPNSLLLEGPEEIDPEGRSDTRPQRHLRSELLRTQPRGEMTYEHGVSLEFPRVGIGATRYVAAP